MNRALTRRELDCLRLLAVGHCDDEIGHVLHIATRTVRFHIQRIKDALGARNRFTALIIALQAGLLQLESLDVSTAVPLDRRG